MTADPAAASADDRDFPADFLWGAATAAYQIEGAVDVDGRGPSIWDTFSHTPGAVEGGDTGDEGTRHYERWREDIGILQELGVGAYRFSIAWPRVMPTGSGALNPAGLAFYDRLIDGLLEAGIQPWATLYHWDLPQPLQDAGGWPARATAERFADYAAAMGERFGDRVAGWCTLNEPWCAAILGYWNGVHAPGIRDTELAVAASYHLNLAHGLGATALRDAGVRAPVGPVLNFGPVRPASDDPADVVAAARYSELDFALYLEPMIHGRLNPMLMAAIEARGYDLSYMRDDDLRLMSPPSDFVGVNYYTTNRVTHLEEPNAAAMPGAEHIRVLPPEGHTTAMGWAVDAGGFEELLCRLHAETGLPVIVAENGAAYDDEVAADGSVHDADRVAYLRDHIAAVAAARSAGADVRGYFVWSLMDNFEWSYGYAKRFGIVRVDYDTYDRTLKDSARWYAQLTRTGQLPQPAHFGV